MDGGGEIDGLGKNRWVIGRSQTERVGSLIDQYRDHVRGNVSSGDILGHGVGKRRSHKGDRATRDIKLAGWSKTSIAEAAKDQDSIGLRSSRICRIGNDSQIGVAIAIEIGYEHVTGMGNGIQGACWSEAAIRLLDGNQDGSHKIRDHNVGTSVAIEVACGDTKGSFGHERNGSCWLERTIAIP